MPSNTMLINTRNKSMDKEESFQNYYQRLKDWWQEI